MTVNQSSNPLVHDVIDRLRNDFGVVQTARLVMDSRRCRAGDVFVA